MRLGADLGWVERAANEIGGGVGPLQKTLFRVIQGVGVWVMMVVIMGDVALCVCVCSR